MSTAKSILFFFSLVICLGCTEHHVVIQHGRLSLTFNDKLHSTVTSVGSDVSLTKSFSATEYVVTDNVDARDFLIDAARSRHFKDEAGEGNEWILAGTYDKRLTKILQIKLYDSLPDMAVMNVSYVNCSAIAIPVSRWVNHGYFVRNAKDTPEFWSFQGGSTSERKDWVQPIREDFEQKNYMGLTSTDYGGGIPVTDIWRRDCGIAIGHLDLKPKMVSLPVKFIASDSSVGIGIENEFETTFFLTPGDTLKTLETFVLVHQGDYYQGMKKYGLALRKKGVVFAEPEPAAFEALWCAWGYGRKFSIDEVVGTLPMVRKLGIKWVTIDDGYQQALGDWSVDQTKFPGGSAQMKSLVDRIHSNGLKAMLWWAPLATDPNSKLVKENPDMKLLNKDLTPRDITWWDAYYLSPADQKTIEHTEKTLDLFINQWGYDGLKMDGQHLNATPADYNPAHHLKHPEDAYESVPAFFKMIYTKAGSFKKHLVMQNCPCGTCMSVYNMPFMNQAVASDPLSSWQVRHKGKTYKALIPGTAYFGDHVELSDRKSDFASSFGVGAVLGTKFTWPRDNPVLNENNVLTKSNEVVWAKWFSLYNKKLLSKSRYRGELYDIGYDLPEAHAIQKSDTMHYSFYNPDWRGDVELRGLESRVYQVYDYINNVDYGTVSGPTASLNVSFKNSLLLEVYPSDGVRQRKPSGE